MKKVICLIITAVTLCGLSACKKNVSYYEKPQYVMRLNCNPDKISGDYECKFVYNYGGEGKVRFNLYANAYKSVAVSENVIDTAYYDGVNYGGITLDNVYVNGEIATITYGDGLHFIDVYMPKDVKTGDTVSVSASIDVDIPKINHRLGLCKNGIINVAWFYPVLAVYDGKFEETKACVYGDNYNADSSDYFVDVTVPSTYVVCATGSSETVTYNGDVTEYSYTLYGGRDFMMCLYEGFSVLQGDVCGKTVNYYYFDDENAEKTLTFAESCLRYFSDTFGEYAYDTFSLCQTLLSSSGMEYSSACQVAYTTDYLEYLYAICHEIAHEWWYSAVGNNQINESFLDEGLAEYSCYRFFRDNESYGIDSDELLLNAVKSYNGAVEVLTEIYGDCDTCILKPLTAFVGEYAYVNFVYNGGLIIFCNIETVYGVKKVDKALSDYYGRYKFKRATYEDIKNCFSKYAVKSDKLFDKLIICPTIPVK